MNHSMSQGQLRACAWNAAPKANTARATGGNHQTRDGTGKDAPLGSQGGTRPRQRGPSHHANIVHAAWCRPGADVGLSLSGHGTSRADGPRDPAPRSRHRNPGKKKKSCWPPRVNVVSRDSSAKWQHVWTSYHRDSMLDLDRCCSSHYDGNLR